MYTPIRKVMKMYRLHCDLCGRDVSEDENVTRITWEDNNGYDFDFGHVFRKPRKFKADICDECLETLRKKAQHD